VSLGAALGAACAACSLVTSYDGFTGGPPKDARDGGSDGAGLGGHDAGAHDSGCVMFDGGCIPPTPPGWTGPFVLLDPASSVTPCPGGAAAPHRGYANLVSAPASCTPCSCGTVAASCSVPQAEEFPGPGCPTPFNDMLPLTQGSCRSLDYAVSFVVTESSPVVSCPATGGAASVTVPVWAEMALVCSPAASDGPCPSGSTCVAATEPPFQGFCIYAPGTFESCPAGSIYQTPHVYYEGYADRRGCTKCECTPPHATCDSSTVDLKFFGATDTCTGSSVAFSAGECQAGVTATLSSSVEAAGAPTLKIEPPGVCVLSSGGQPTGTAAPVNSFTVCCM
jgi:hypothetical protein